MKYCMRCGQQLDDDVHFCPVCGLRQPDVPAQPNYQPVQSSTIDSGKAPATNRNHNILFFVWSIILIFICNPIGTPLGILGSLFAAMANSGTETPENSAKYIRVSKIMCIIATVIDALCFIALLFFKEERIFRGR